MGATYLQLVCVHLLFHIGVVHNESLTVLCSNFLPKGRNQWNESYLCALGKKAPIKVSQSILLPPRHAIRRYHDLSKTLVVLSSRNQRTGQGVAYWPFLNILLLIFQALKSSIEDASYKGCQIVSGHLGIPGCPSFRGFVLFILSHCFGGPHPG